MRKFILILTLFALVVAACAPKSLSTAVSCSQISVRYIAGGQSNNTGTYTYHFEAVRASDDIVVGSAEGPVVPEDAEFEVVIPLDKTYDPGTLFYVRETANYNGTLETVAKPCGTTWFEPGDERINRQAYAQASVYCDAENQRVGVYGIQSSSGVGIPAIFIPYAELPPTPGEEAGHLLIAQYGDIRFYRLTTGEFQINAGPDFEGKEYVFVWDGCPSTQVKSFIFQNGVTTMTEMFPRPE